MEQTVKDVLNHPHTQEMRNIVNREINWGDPKREYFADFSVFKKSDEEKGKLATLKHKWRESLKLTGDTKRKFKFTHIIKIN